MESAMTESMSDSRRSDGRLFLMLRRLLSIRAADLRPVLDEASTIIAETFGADKVDVFVYQADADTLVALGTSKTPMGERQRALGLDRLPLSNGGRGAWSFRTGEPYSTDHADEDPEELRGIVEGLGVRSMMNHPIEIDGARRGLIQVDSASPDFFTEPDRDALAAVAGWIGLIMHRADLVEQMTAEAERRGRRQAGDEIARITRRQQEIAIMIAAGLTNAQIAQRAVLSSGTVANHIENILRRLNLASRTQIAVWAVERGLYRSDQDEDESEGLPDQSRRRSGRASDVPIATD
jgi:DNA-binding CsgD family transcriptional regulator